ncbi:MAG TPA: cytidyltransferase [Clostridia bacterium]|nr:cytidyltransferase [Clostridia bacterium]
MENLFESIENIIESNLNSNPSLNNRIKSMVMEKIRGGVFRAELERIEKEKDYTCQAVLSLMKEIMLGFSGGFEPKDWLNYIYQHALEKSFPNAVQIEMNNELDSASELYIDVLSAVAQCQKESDDGTWQSKYAFEFLKETEIKDLENSYEYEKFMDVFKSDHVYEMMKLNQELLGYSTLDHILGVHYLALFIARQLKEAGVAIDLGRVSGAAAGHDIGKYGCKGLEMKRVPYLHYYYTDEWFKKHDIVYIRNIAVNHSTWDLELEALPIESLVLIYSDFRVKQKKVEGSLTDMHVYSLDESFRVILGKLDNVDSMKRKRYDKVYKKLKDFQAFMRSKGLELDVEKSPAELSSGGLERKSDLAMLQGDSIIESIKMRSIDHNIKLMHSLRDESSLNAILEHARSESDINNLRGYLNVIEEYSTYLTQKQKLSTLNFLYDQLTHSEDDIRNQSASLMGVLIATLDEEYRKEVPESVRINPPEISSYQIFDKYLQMALYPDIETVPVHQYWIGYSARKMIESLFMRCRPMQKKNYLETVSGICAQLEKETSVNKRMYFIEILKRIGLGSCQYEDVEKPYKFLGKCIYDDDIQIRVSAKDAVKNILDSGEDSNPFFDRLKRQIHDKFGYSELPAENFLNLRIAMGMGMPEEVVKVFESHKKKDDEKLSYLFLSNLKTATPWIIKKIHVEVMLEKTMEDMEKNGLHTAMHYCNLLKVSASPTVRNKAGESLVKIFHHLSFDQRNDIAVELIRALEIENYQFTKYIPAYLGRLVLYLKPVELDEFIDDMVIKAKSANPQIESLLFETIGVTIENYAEYRRHFPENREAFENRQIRLLGILMNGIVSFNQRVKYVAFGVIGKNIFKSNGLDLQKTHRIFELIAKKLLTLLDLDAKDESILFLTNAAGLNDIYRFISDYTHLFGGMHINKNNKIAFFPGTFDPFSLSHKEIAREIRDMGYEVYLAVDEFSWSKRTQPNLIRRNIIRMSVSDELGIYLFPENRPINIANPEDLEKLSEVFEDSKVYLVIGSDVLMNASAYKADGPIRSFNHIIFERKGLIESVEDDRRLDEACKGLKGEAVRLVLKPEYEDISSTLIRRNIDEKRDISNLIDPMAQKYIYEKGLYRREPQYKTIMRTKSKQVELLTEFDGELLKELSNSFFDDSLDAFQKLKLFTMENSPKIILIRDLNDENRIIAFSLFHLVKSSSLYKEFMHDGVSEYVRENSMGRIIIIDGLFLDPTRKDGTYSQILLTETLGVCLKKDYSYAIYYNKFKEHETSKLHEILVLNGFQRVPYSIGDRSVFVVKMISPSIITLDASKSIKEPYQSHPMVQKTIEKARKKLLKSLTGLYPGHLMLSFDRNMIYDKMIEMICKENGVSVNPVYPKKTGENMCVPFGKVLNGQIVPNTVTKSMHTERYFEPFMKTNEMKAYPYYVELENQVKIIRSFNRPVFLIDDLLHKGYRFKVVNPLFEKENIEVKKIIVGILSGRGKELMEIENRDVETAYFIPRLKTWFNENSLYPFLGGDTLWRGEYHERNMIPSVNLILPFMSPYYIRGASKQAVYELSKTCLENAHEIVTTIEEVYQIVNERSLTMAALAEVFMSPRFPDHGRDMHHDLNLSPSTYLLNDMETLEKLKRIITEK